MEARFEIQWRKQSKNNSEPIRTTLVRVPSAEGSVGIDCSRAVDLFCGCFGNLKKNEIIKIRELDENGNQIGEDITPSDKEVIMPVKKK